MKRLALSLAAAALVLSAGAAHAQSYAITKTQQKQLTVFAPKGPVWPTDKNGNPIPSAQHQCPPGFHYAEVTVQNPFSGAWTTMRACLRG